jgi:hypothetical protein
MSKTTNKPLHMGSITIEVSIALPIFLLCMFSLFSLMSVSEIRTKMQLSLDKSISTLASEFYWVGYAMELGYYENDSNRRLSSRLALLSLLDRKDPLTKVSYASWTNRLFLSKQLNTIEIEFWKTQYLVPETRVMAKSQLLTDSFSVSTLSSTTTWLVTQELNNTIPKELFIRHRFGSFIGNNTGLSTASNASPVTIKTLEILSDNQSLTCEIEYPIVVKLPIFPSFIVQGKHSSSARVWVNANLVKHTLEKNEESLWNLSPLQYGKIISALELSLWPVSYPVGDTLYEVRSINLYAKSYQNPINFKAAVRKSIQDLAKKLQGSTDISHLKKTLIVVVPEGKMNAMYHSIWMDCKKEASAVDPTMELILKEGYGYPKNP